MEENQMENNKMIITISREFGSGGRELGKRLSYFAHTAPL